MNFLSEFSVTPWFFLIPLVAACIILLVPAKKVAAIHRVASGSMILTFLLAFWCFFNYDAAAGGHQFVTRLPWIEPLGVYFHFGLDGIGLPMVLLHSILSLSGVYVSYSIKKDVKTYFVFYLMLVASIFGVFTSLDLLFLYLFYEMAVIPMYPLIGIWGSKNREYAAMKLTLFISLGAVVGLVGLIALYVSSGIKTFDLIELSAYLKQHPFSDSFQIWCAPLIIFGFGVIASLWPFHSWSPIGYAAAPSAVSMLHAGVLKKLGIFIIIRIAIALLPEGSKFWFPLVAWLCVVNILYGAWAAMVQKDLKFVIGFASVSHMGYAFLGLACLNGTGLTGTVFFMFAHGIMAALCFALIGFIYDQTHTRMIPDLGGLAKNIPVIAICFVMAALASSGLPGFANFVSEMLIFFAAWDKYPIQTSLAIFGIVITAVYMLRLLRNVFFGPAKSVWAELQDPQAAHQRIPLGLLIGALLIFGFWPSLLLNQIRPTTELMMAATSTSARTATQARVAVQNHQRVIS
jgi:NADH-quinone oxidoreductase subunit M